MADQQLIARMATASLDLKAGYKHLLTEGVDEDELQELIDAAEAAEQERRDKIKADKKLRRTVQRF